MKKTEHPKDVDTYLSSLPDKVRITLEKLRKTIKSSAPMAQEVISYRMPAYKYLGPIVFFAAFENHCSLFPASKAIAKKFSKELKDFDMSGTTIHFSAEKPLPANIVKKIVKAKIQENELRAKRKQN